MSPETIARLEAELIGQYSGVGVAREGQVTLVRLPEVTYPRGCSPAAGAALMILDPQQPTPRLLVKQAPTLPNGRSAKNVSAETAAGEGWYTYSFNQPWNEASHTAVQYVESRLRRFALSE